MTIEFLRPRWPAPPTVHAAISTRAGGVSATPWDNLNLATHVGDEPARVAENRRRLREALCLPAEPCWLEQVHGCGVVAAIEGPAECPADASVADAPGHVCAVLTADCLPVLFCDRAGRWVAAAHAGWRGLAAGILERTVARAPVPPVELIAWLGPALGPRAFEVGDEVRAGFVADDAGAARCFTPSPAGRWLADLYALARRRLSAAGIGWIGGGGECTYSDPRRYYSYRRDGVTGRMASLVWLAE